MEIIAHACLSRQSSSCRGHWNDLEEVWNQLIIITKKTKSFTLCNYPIFKKLIFNCEIWGPVFLLVCEIMVGKSSLVPYILTDFSCEYVGNVSFFPQLSALACAQGYLCLCTVFHAHPSDFVTHWGSRKNTLSPTWHHRPHKS